MSGHTFDETKRAWRVAGFLVDGRRCIQFVNAETSMGAQDEAMRREPLLSAEQAEEIDPKTGERI